MIHIVIITKCPADLGTCGTAQRSVLGLLFYIIYVNDVLNFLSEENSMTHHADDILIILHNWYLDVMRGRLQKILKRIVAWCKYDKLTRNWDKTKFMLISLRSSENMQILTIDSNSLVSVAQYAYLGMILDKTLNMI